MKKPKKVYPVDTSFSVKFDGEVVSIVNCTNPHAVIGVGRLGVGMYNFNVYIPALEGGANKAVKSRKEPLKYKSPNQQ